MTRIRSIGCIALLAFFAMFGQVVSSATNLSSSGGAGKHRRVAVGRLTLNFNSDWKFTKSDPSGASTNGFDDRSWIPVSLPHTYNDTDTFDNWSTPGHRGEQIQWGGRTWYRKTFTLPLAYRGKKVFIEFEGVRQVGEVYLNGHLLGVSKTGFTPFGFDLTPYLRFGTAPNVLAVMCDNRFARDPLDQHTAAALAKAGAGVPSTPNPNLAQLSAKFNQTVPDNVDQLQADQIPWNNPHWHPAHGGIYRNVRLYIVDPLHIDLPLYSFLKTVGPYVYASDISGRAARISIEIPVTNGRKADARAQVNARVLDVQGKVVLSLQQTQNLAAGAHTLLRLSGMIEQPKLWEPDYPCCYHTCLIPL
jgi:beta-galactosidase